MATEFSSRSNVVHAPTLEDALEVAAEAWSDGAGAKVMTTMAGRCVALLGPTLRVSELRPAHGQDLLERLNGWSRGESGRRPLSAKAVIDYYRAFRRMLAIGGVEIDGWPRPPKLPQRKAREVASAERLEEAIGWLRQKGWGDTADLAHLILHTGLRAKVEALRPEALKVTRGDAYDVLEVAYGAGRAVPVTDGEAALNGWRPFGWSPMRATSIGCGRRLPLWRCLEGRSSRGP